MDGVVIWMLPYTGKWYVDVLDDSEASETYIDTHFYTAKAYDTLVLALADPRLNMLTKDSL